MIKLDIQERDGFLIMDDFPKNCIFNKVKTGCGATTIALTNDENYIIAVPTTELVINKCYPPKDKNGKDKYHTYRRKDVLAFRKKYADDLLRPVFDWSAQQVIDYILENGIQPNPLYRMGYKRVGCFPCVMASQQDIYNISVQEPERISYIAGLEQQFNSSFFGPDKISSKYYKGEYPLISDVVRYVQSKRAGGSLFDDDVATSCMSYYGLCE